MGGASRRWSRVPACSSSMVGCRSRSCNTWSGTRTASSSPGSTLAYPVLRIGIDYDGRVHNEDKVRVRDGRRRNRLLALGWTPLTFYADDYHRAGGQAILTQVREAVTAARRAQAG